MPDVESLTKEEEREILLDRMFGKWNTTLLQVGKELGEGYCKRFNEQGYDEKYNRYDMDEALKKVSHAISDDQLLHVANKFSDKLQSYHDFTGQYFNYQSGAKRLLLESSWPKIKDNLEILYRKHGTTLFAILQACLKVNFERNMKYDNYYAIQSVSKELGAQKGWMNVLADLELFAIIWKHKGNIEIPEEIAFLVKTKVDEWESRPITEASRSVRVTEHSILQNLVKKYPASIFNEDLQLREENTRLKSGDMLDLVFQDLNGKYVVVDIKPEYDEEAIGQLMRYRKGLSEEKAIPEGNIRLVVVSKSPVESKFASVATSIGIEIFALDIVSKRVA